MFLQWLKTTLLLLKMFGVLITNLLVIRTWTQLSTCNVNDDLLENDELYLVAIKVQAQKWRTHNKDSISWRFFCCQWQIYLLFCELIDAKMYRLQVSTNSWYLFNQSFVFHKGLFKYNKTNSVTLMKTHVDFAHSCFVAKKKLLLTKKFMVKHVDLNHS